MVYGTIEKDDRATVGQGKQKFGDGHLHDNDIIVLSEFKLEGYFLQTFAPNYSYISWQVMIS